ncbi:unnamed protein product [Lampetra planeri]
MGNRMAERLLASSRFRTTIATEIWPLPRPTGCRDEGLWGVGGLPRRCVDMLRGPPVVRGRCASGGAVELCDPAFPAALVPQRSRHLAAEGAAHHELEQSRGSQLGDHLGLHGL